MTGKFTDASGDPDRTQTRTTGLDMLPAGTVLADRYRIEEIIGVGGMGMVYRARDLQLDTDVALKLLRTDQQPDADSLGRFRREILLARQVSHPNVVRLHDLGRDGDAVFLTMDHVPGQTLSELLAESTLSIEQVLRIGHQVAEGLAAAHDQGIVHRDLKPGNILIDREGNARILDFGVARAMDEQSLTVAGEVVGTPAYLSPEQVRAEQVDHRSDIFALGLIICEALSGRPPNSDGTLDELLGQRATGRTIDPTRLRPDLPSWLVRVIRNCLAGKPEDRYQSAADLAEELKLGVSRSTARRRGRLGLAAVAVVTLAVMLGWLVWSGDRGTVTEPDGTVHLAIMPLANATGRDTMDWSGRSLAQGLSETLAEAPSMQVVDSLRLFRLIEDLGVEPGIPDGSVRRQIFELLELDHLISGRVESTDQGMRIELYLHQGGRQDDPLRLFVETDSMAPLEALPDLAGQILENLTGHKPDLPAPPTSDIAQALELFDSGMARLSRRDNIAAIEMLERAVVADPEYAAAWTHLAEAQAAAGHYNQAVDSARKAVELLADHGGRLSLEAEARLADLSGDPERARNILQSLVERFPGDIKARVQLSELLIDQGHMSEARQQLEQVVKAEPQNGQAWFLLGKLDIISGNPARAAEDYLVRALVIENRTGSAASRGDVVNALGIAHLHIGDLESAETYFSDAIALRQQAGDRRGVAATRANLAHLSMLRGDFDRARSELSLALEDREKLGDQAGMAELYNQQGVVEEELGDYQAALASYREAMRIHERLGHGRALADSYNNVAFAYFMLGEYDNARQFNRSALERLASNGSRAGRAMALETRGYLEVAGGRLDTALATFIEVLELSRDINQPQSEAVARGGIALVARHQGRYAAALEALERAVKIVTDLDDARGQAIYQVQLAELNLDAGRIDHAASHLHSAREAMDTAGSMLQGDYLRLKGRIDAARNKPDSAVAALSEAREMAATAGLVPRALRAELALEAVRETATWDDLVVRAERLDDAVLMLKAIYAAGRRALNAGERERALQLAHRALRPPVALDTWSDNWRLHWLVARADSGDTFDPDHPAVISARKEIARLLSAMPASWHADFREQLPPELANVEDQIN